MSVVDGDISAKTFYEIIGQGGADMIRDFLINEVKSPANGRGRKTRTKCLPKPCDRGFQAFFEAWCGSLFWTTFFILENKKLSVLENFASFPSVCREFQAECLSWSAKNGQGVLKPPVFLWLSAVYVPSGGHEAISSCFPASGSEIGNRSVPFGKHGQR